MSNYYRGKRVLVTGGSGFIGSYLTEELVKLGANVTIIDNLTTGRINNLKAVLGNVRLLNMDLMNYQNCLIGTKDMDIVFHLAAILGGRGYIEKHSGDCCKSFALNENIFRASYQNNVEKIFFPSSACVYPRTLQSEYGSDYLLTEKDADMTNPKNMDTIYGWIKLSGELQLKSYYEQYGIKSAVGRYLTVYGPRSTESHAIIALTLRALRKEDPYVIWGSGKQDRAFTYVTDIVNATLIVTEKIENASSVNMGTDIKYTINEVVDTIFRECNWRPKELKHDMTKPEGPKSRGFDISRIKSLGWKPKVSLKEGIGNIVEYYSLG